MEKQHLTPPQNSKWQPEKSKTATNSFALVSLITGILSLVCICFPPIQLIFGGLAIMFAVLSRQDTKFENLALAGLFIGSLSCIISFMVFWQAMNTLELMKHDPQYISHLNKMIKEIEQMLGAAN